MPDTALRIFIIYAREDEAFRAELIGQLRPMEKAGQVRVWTDRELLAGDHWDAVLKQQLRSADLILLLVSSDYFLSDYIHEVEIKEALERHRNGLAKVVPVIVRPCDWESDPIVSDLQILPTDGAPVADTRHWHTREAAWVDVVRGVRRTAQQLREERAEAERKKREEAERVRQAELAALAAQQEAERRQQEALQQALQEQARQRQLEEQRRLKEEAQAAERQRQADAAAKAQKVKEAAQQAEQAAWQRASTAQDPSLYAAYLAAYPDGTHAREAQAALKTFRQAEKSDSGSVFSLRTVGAGVGILLLAFVAYKVFSGRKASDLRFLPPDMMLVQGGTFQMGRTTGDSNEQPVHTVTVSSFYLSKYEVTVAEFKKFVDDAGYQTDAEKEGSSSVWSDSTWEKKNGVNWRHDAPGNIRPFADYNHPVIHVSWNDATEYCKWLSTLSGRHYRLPTEAEWEYAAANGSRHTKYSWGDVYPSGAQGGNVADETTLKKYSGFDIFKGYTDGYVYTAPVGQYNPNNFGLHDMTGNVWEWCGDWFDLYPSSAQTNPTGSSASPKNLRINRGGSWFNSMKRCITSRRDGNSPKYRGGNLGFRTASPTQ